MSDHAWCTDPARDAAVRAAEDGRDGALPTLEEAIAAAFTAGVKESARKVEDAWAMIPKKAATVDNNAVMVTLELREVAEIVEQRDAAIRERDDLRKSWLRSEESGTRLLAERNAAIDAADVLRKRVAELEAASGGNHFADARKMVEQPRGWLTEEELQAVDAARDHFEDNDHGENECVVIPRVLKQLLARSTPPKVVIPEPVGETQSHGPLLRKRDVVAAIAAAGVPVKEVGSE